MNMVDNRSKKLVGGAFTDVFMRLYRLKIYFQHGKNLKEGK